MFSRQNLGQEGRKPKKLFVNRYIPSKKHILSRHKTKEVSLCGPTMPDLLAEWKQTPLPLSVLHVCTHLRTMQKEIQALKSDQRNCSCTMLPRSQGIKPLTVRHTQPPAWEK